jgi:glyoxylate reductase
MNRPNVFISRRIPDEGLDAIRAACEVDLWPDQLPPPYDELRARVKNCDGLVSLLTDRIDAALLDASPRLKVVSNFAVGFINVDVAACTARGVCVVSTPGVLTDATADTAVTLLVAAARRLSESANDA